MQANLELCLTARSDIRALSSEASFTARTVETENVRVEFLQCRSPATVRWHVARSQISILWVRDKGSNARITMAGQAADRILPGRAKCWFFPEGSGAEGELVAKGAYDCAGVFVRPSFLPCAIKQALAAPIAGFSHDALGQAFGEMTGELTQPGELLSIFTDGWAMQALACVACVNRRPPPSGTTIRSGLTPWQLRRAKELLLADPSENLSLNCVAAACKLSVSHFARAFKVSTGVPPHQWRMQARVEEARPLLAKTTTPLAEVAGIYGFADRSHFSRVFARATGTSPGAWRREHQLSPSEAHAGALSRAEPCDRPIGGVSPQLLRSRDRWCDPATQQRSDNRQPAHDFTKFHRYLPDLTHFNAEAL